MLRPDDDEGRRVRLYYYHLARFGSSKVGLSSPPTLAVVWTQTAAQEVAVSVPHQKTSYAGPLDFLLLNKVLHWTGCILPNYF